MNTLRQNSIQQKRVANSEGSSALPAASFINESGSAERHGLGADPSEIEYSVLILTRNESENLKLLLPQVHEVLGGSGVSYEIVVVDGDSPDGSKLTAEKLGARAYLQKSPGYGSAFREGLSYCKGEWIVCLDADHSHPPQYLRTMIRNTEGVDMLIASRYVPGGDTQSEAYRNVLSKILSFLFGSFLGIPVKDVSSGFRMYRRRVLMELDLDGRDFDVLIEVLIRLVTKGYKVREIPFIYAPREHGKSNARLFKFAVSYLRTLGRMWRLRNSAGAADYEERAYRSFIPLQRYWQRRRTRSILELCDRNASTLDIGSGGSRVSRTLSRLVAVDVNRSALRYLHDHGVVTINADFNSLPFEDGRFKQIVFAQVLQHVPKAELSFDEISRVLSSDGSLIVSTPNYDSFLWRFLEAIYVRLLPNAPGSNHCARYTKSELVNLLSENGFLVEDIRSIHGADITVKVRKSFTPEKVVSINR